MNRNFFARPFGGDRLPPPVLGEPVAHGLVCFLALAAKTLQKLASSENLWAAVRLLARLLAMQKWLLNAFASLHGPDWENRADGICCGDFAVGKEVLAHFDLKYNGNIVFA